MSGMSKSGKKDTEQLLRKARKMGYTVEMDGGGHWKVTSPTGETVTVAATPSSRGFMNGKARLKRIGVA